MSGVPRKLSLLLALAAAAVLSGAARAQDMPQVVSPLRIETDHQGVNLATGRMAMPIPTLGVPGAPRLRFDRVQNAAPYFLGRPTGQFGEYPQGNYSIHTGAGPSDSFSCFDFACESLTGTGSTFDAQSGRYQQGGTGTIYEFESKSVDTFGTTPRRQYYAEFVRYQDGEVIHTSYDEPLHSSGAFIHRPRRIESNRGYYVLIDYHPGVLGTVEWNTPATASLYAMLGPGDEDDVLLQRLTYSLPDLNGVVTITDIGGRVYRCAGCNNSMGVDIETFAGSLTLPGEGSDATLVVTPAPPPPGFSASALVGRVERDDVPWTYSYDGVGTDP